jgi:hypothetical protein
MELKTRTSKQMNIFIINWVFWVGFATMPYYITNKEEFTYNHRFLNKLGVFSFLCC